MVGSDLKKALGTFLRSRLKLDNAFLVDMGDVSIKKVAAGPRSKITGEVIAVFSTVAVRDTVRGMARELAGDPDAGVRLEIPHGLQTNLKALESLSYNLKKKYPDLRRNIRFDDDEMDLVLHFSTNPEANVPWKKVKPEQAKALKAKLGRAAANNGVEDVTDEDLGNLLDGPGVSMGVP